MRLISEQFPTDSVWADVSRHLENAIDHQIADVETVSIKLGIIQAPDLNLDIILSTQNTTRGEVA